MAKKEEFVDRSNELVDYFYPRRDRTHTQQFVSVNGENALIQTGVPIKIKRKFAEVLDNSLAMEKFADEYIDTNAN